MIAVGLTVSTHSGRKTFPELAKGPFRLEHVLPATRESFPQPQDSRQFDEAIVHACTERQVVGFGKAMAEIEFESTLTNIGPRIILRLPESASEKLPTRGMTMVKGKLNGVPIVAPLEPDGKGSHWLELDEMTRLASGAHVGDRVALEIEPTKDWPEPEVPKDLEAALANEPKAQAIWDQITTAARWDWIRWIRSTNSAETRKRRVEVAISKMDSGMRRPCCFNRNICTVPEVSKNGVLVE